VTPTRGWTFVPTPTPDGRRAVEGPFLGLSSGVQFPDRSELLAIPESGSPDDPLVRIRLEVDDDMRPVCTSIAFESQPDGPALSAGAIRIDFVALKDAAIAYQAAAARYGVSRLQDGRVHIPPGHSLTKEQMAGIERDALRIHRQRSVNDELLREVARIYLAAGHAPTEAVKDQLGTSKRNATRWVALARERDFLPKLPPKKEG
jgi:hypothetical protein